MTVSFLEFWYQALRADVGIEIETDDRERLRQRLYQDRTKALDPELDGLSIVFSPLSEDKVWIVKRHAEKKI